MIDNNLSMASSTTTRTSNASLNTNSTNLAGAAAATTDKLNSSDYDNYELQITDNLNSSLSSSQSSSSSSANENTATCPTTTMTTLASNFTPSTKPIRVAAAKPCVKNAFSTINVSQIASASKMANISNKLINSDCQNFGSLKRQKRYFTQFFL